MASREAPVEHHHIDAGALLRRRVWGVKDEAVTAEDDIAPIDGCRTLGRRLEGVADDRDQADVGTPCVCGHHQAEVIQSRGDLDVAGACDGPVGIHSHHRSVVDVGQPPSVADVVSRRSPSLGRLALLRPGLGSGVIE